MHAYPNKDTNNPIVASSKCHRCISLHCREHSFLRFFAMQKTMRYNLKTSLTQQAPILACACDTILSAHAFVVEKCAKSCAAFRTQQSFVACNSLNYALFPACKHPCMLIVCHKNSNRTISMCNKACFASFSVVQNKTCEIVLVCRTLQSQNDNFFLAMILSCENMRARLLCHALQDSSPQIVEHATNKQFSVWNKQLPRIISVMQKNNVQSCWACA